MMLSFVFLQLISRIVMITRLAIMASGNGTNAQRIMEFFSITPRIRAALLLCNNPEAFVLERAQKMKVPTIVFDRKEFTGSRHILDILSIHGIDWIILAGFLWLIPKHILSCYPGRIINIHPALLPKYGGKGMYGMKVHEAVIHNREKESGITIHYVNEFYDEGQVIFQEKCPVFTGDTPATLASRVHELEYRWYPEVIERTILEKTGKKR